MGSKFLNKIAMPNTKMSDILKSGDNFSLSDKDVDFTSERVKRRFRRVKEEQEKSRKRKNVDWAKLNTFVIPWAH